MGLFPMEDPAYAATYAQEAAMVDASELIARALEDADVTPAELARLLNVSRSEITARLRGERNITVRKLAQTLHALGAELELGVHMREETPGQKPSLRWNLPDIADDHKTDASTVRPQSGRWKLESARQ
ncbi:helix-turn-helix domain-containing protein [Agromyces sp. NPDC056965]|uniref:helix-turn-helix domain-containing protein n=1 Tax=Agromyces sp. NPDC056965 TaxID=3345983 RepID=UPI00363AE2EB